MRNKEKQRWETAYHEAGHLAIAHRLGCRIHRATIEPAEHYSGRVTFQSLLGRVDIEFEIDHDKKRRNRGRIEDAIVIALAGPFAQRHYSPRSNWRIGATGARRGELLVRGTDFDHVSELIFRFYGNDETARHYRRYVEARAKDLVEGNWIEIEAIARCLFEHGTISRDQAIEAMREAVTAAIEARRQGLT
jgi:hypothetical protein